MENSDWIEWKGGECPVAPGAKVDVKFRNGFCDLGQTAGFWSGSDSWWEHRSDDHKYDIIAYRIVKDRHDD